MYISLLSHDKSINLSPQVAHLIIFRSHDILLVLCGLHIPWNESESHETQQNRQTLHAANFNGEQSF